MPEGADTVTARNREGADTVTGANPGRSGQSSHKVRTLTPEGAVTVSTVLGKAPRKSTKEGKRTRAPLRTMGEWWERCRDDEDKAIRSEERGGGKGCVSTCRVRGG